MSDSPKSYSMLLYGPPGTGKTTIAKNLADALAFPLITVTVSDFLGHGGAQIEARAKAIFDVLSSQTECVVLFDEIDNFLLDRDSDRYAKQDSIFQFMTPGMLTKLNDLREAERIIFIVATNYENRIDSAIKRIGRIDHSYLVLTPDKKSRWRMIEEALEGRKQFESLADRKEEIERASVFLGHTDIEACVAEADRASTDKVQALIDSFAERARTMTPNSYLSRFPEKANAFADSGPPVEEFLCLVALAAEVKAERYLTGRVFGRAKQYFDQNDPGDLVAVIKDRVKGISDELAAEVAKALARGVETR